MGIAIGVCLVAVSLLANGCALFHHQPSKPEKAKPTQPQSKAVIKPDLRVTGSVAMVNPDARFVIISFPAGSVPGVGTHLGIFRNGLKVGEVSVAGPQRDNDTVADIISGNVQLHDDAKQE